MADDSRFEAEVMVQAKADKARRRVELRFRDTDGATHVLSLPAVVAAALTPVLSGVAAEVGVSDQAPGFSRKAKRLSVGRAPESKSVVLWLDEYPPAAVDIPMAKKLWRAIRDEVEFLERSKPATKQ